MSMPQNKLLIKNIEYDGIKDDTGLLKKLFGQNNKKHMNDNK
jgi:hypothetical protein